MSGSDLLRHENVSQKPEHWLLQKQLSDPPPACPAAFLEAERRADELAGNDVIVRLA